MSSRLPTVIVASPLTVRVPFAVVIGPAGRRCANARDGSRPASSRRTASRRHVHMGWYSYTVAYIITEPCIGTKDTACVDVCPVDCIHPRKDEHEFATVDQL